MSEFKGTATSSKI
uniref:Uncharacterized protein n=1 Tax=Anguilla anguilla TaxID=7936 RepID=A0A0E9W7Y0_ANGAN